MVFRSDCSVSSVARTYDGVPGTDESLLRYYRCRRLGKVSGGERMLEVGVGSLVFGVILAVVLAGW